jgi:hypothetical protein
LFSAAGAIREYVALHAWQIEEMQKGIAEAHRGEFATPPRSLKQEVAPRALDGFAKCSTTSKQKSSLSPTKTPSAAVRLAIAPFEASQGPFGKISRHGARWTRTRYA